MKKWLSIIAVLLLVFIAGMMSSYHLQLGADSSSSKQVDREVLYWVAPMDPNYRRDKPGQSPMGMDLVPVYADEQSGDQGTVSISPMVENNIGVKTAQVKQMDLSRIINTVGYMTVDENNIEYIHTYSDGWIKALNVKTTGELVKQGQLLLELYSPTLNNAQEEFILALRNNNAGLINAGEKKLLTLGMAQSQINQLRKTRQLIEQVKIYATQGGIVSQLNVREGKFVKPDSTLMTIEDLSPIWMIAEVFERQADWVDVGQTAIATLPYMPGKTWQGEVDYVYPELDQKTHTLRVRLSFPNPDLTIKPNMYANIKISSPVAKNALTIPRSALIRTGQGDRVIVALGNGKYTARAVKIGIESGDVYQILAGLDADDHVVTSAQFLIDSESNLKAEFDRMDNHDLNHDTELSMAESPQEFVGMGVVKQVDRTNHRLTLDHQAMPELNMPAMTMELKVEASVNLENVMSNDEIHFVLIKQESGNYLVTNIHNMTPHN